MHIITIKKRFLQKMKIISWLPLTGHGGVQFTWLCDQAQAVHFHGQSSFLKIACSAGGFACGVLSIDRENPGPSAIKYPVNMLKKEQSFLIMFPSGSRHSTDVKGGVAVIAKMAKVRIMPVVYAGPMSLKGLAAGSAWTWILVINCISDIKKMNDEGVEEVARRIHSEFDRLDAEVAPYQTQKKAISSYGFYVPLPLFLLFWLEFWPSFFSFFLLALSGVRISTENKRLISLLSNLAWELIFYASEL